MNKIILLNILLIGGVLSEGLFASTMKSRRNQDGFENSFSGFAKEQKDDKIEYKIDNRAKDLHIKAVKAFYQADFKDSEACFSLSMQLWAKSEVLLFEYALCSSLYPKPQRSFVRAEELKKLYLKRIKRENSKFHILEAIFHWQKGNLESSVISLKKVSQKDKLSKISDKMLENIELKNSLLDESLLMQLMPRRENSITRRSQRN